MQRINTPDGQFHAGDPTTGALGTIVTQPYMQAVQEEIAGTVESAGITLDPNDNGQLLKAIKAIGSRTAPLADTGTMNAYAAANVVPLTAATLVHGVRQRVTIATTNSGASTYSPDGLPPKPILGLDLIPLEGLELLATQVADLEYAIAPSLNGGNGAWLLLRCAGGALQLPAFSYGVTPEQNDKSNKFATTAWGNGIAAHGQCRLSGASATSIKLSPFNGQNVIIGGTVQQIPAAGVTMSNAGLPATTLRYVYAYMNADAMALEAVTTTHATGANGVEQKLGDASRTLVGMIYTNASGEFASSSDWLGCITYFNRRAVNIGKQIAASFSFTNTTVAEISSTVRSTFLTWADDCVSGGADGELSMNAYAGNASVAITATIDGGNGSGCSYTSVGVGYGQSFSSHNSVSLSEGVHVASIYGNVSGCTGTIYEGAVAWTIRG